MKRVNMERKEFLKSACRFGVCSCTGMALLSGQSILAASAQSEQEKPDWRFGFMQKRFATLLEIINSSVDEETKSQMIEQLGRACAKENEASYLKFKGNVQDYLKTVEKEWAEKTLFDESAKCITLISKKNGSCFCPLVDPTGTPKSFCNCSLGYHKETFEAILGQLVEARVVESVLRGGERCCFEIRYV